VARSIDLAEIEIDRVIGAIGTGMAAGRPTVTNGYASRARVILGRDVKLLVRRLCRGLMFVFCRKRPPSKMLPRKLKPGPRHIPFTLWRDYSCKNRSVTSCASRAKATTSCLDWVNRA
jgi:hypothetical protein